MLRRNVTLAVLVALVMVMGLVPAGVAVAEEECERFGQGYWKQWLADPENETEDYLGEPHASGKLLDMLDTPARGDADQILTYQFIAAALNVAVNECEMPPAVQDAFDAAKEHLHGDAVSEDRSEILGWKDILEFWNQNEYAELLRVEYEGICDEFGSHIGDVMTFTFSNDVFQPGDISIQPVNLHTHHRKNFDIDGNVLTVTINETFAGPRDLSEPVKTITGLYDFIGNPVVVPEGGVPIEVNSIYPTVGAEGTFTSHPNYYLPGEWSYDITIEVGCEGGFRSGEVVLVDRDGEEVVATVLEIKYDYPHWSDTPNIAAVGTATYLGETYSFMALYAERALWMALSESDYQDRWEAGGVYSSGDRAYDIHSENTYEFPIFWQ